MSNVSIYEKNWIDLVFEGKNKAYGAYKLRQEDSKTSLLALIGGVSFFCGAIGLGLFLTSFGDATTVTLPDTDTIIRVDNFTYPPEKNNEPEKEIIPLIKKEEPTEKVESKDLVDPTIVESKNATDVVTKNVDLGKTKTDDPNPNGGKSDGTPTTNTGGGNPGGEGENKGPGVIVTTNQLDKLPEYPGGIKKFYDYVGKNITRPEIDEDSGEITMSVIMSFVIEKDGSMSDIKVLRSTDAKLEKEAIRVLKALKVKWAPGVKDGNNVRTQYMLPIKVKI